MPYIYKISNDVNDKVYIGKTNFSIEKRWEEHKRDTYRARCEKRPLYNAIILYGVEHFKISLIEECSNDREASLREQYWINYFNSFENGYNATIGGDGRSYRFTTQEEIENIVSMYNSNKTVKEIAKELQCDHSTISRVLKEQNINIGVEKVRDKFLRSYGLVLINGVERLEFKTKEEALEYLHSINSDAEKDSIRKGVNRVLNGSRKTYLGYYIIKVE